MRDDRSRLLSTYAALVDEREAAESEDPEHPDLGRIDRELATLRHDYLAALPSRTLSAAPDTGALLSVAFDDVDLDGLYWDFQEPVRPFRSPGAGCIAVDGAMTIDRGSVADAAFLASPGASVPSIVPDVLEAHDARAVLSSIPIGPHRGYVVAYYAFRPDPRAPLLDDWGASEHWRTDERGDWVRATRPEYEIERDFDLEAWIRRGRLGWIEPDDESWTIRDDVSTCPYLGLEGGRSRQYVQYGRVWSGDGGDDTATLGQR